MRTPEEILRKENPTDGMEGVVAAFRYPAKPKGARWPALAGAATALVVGGTVVRLSAPSAEASPFKRIAQAENAAPRCTVTMFDARGKLRARGWQEGAKARYDNDPDAPYGYTNAFDGARTWFVRRDAGVGIISNGTIRQATPPFLQKVGDFTGDVIRWSKNEDGTHQVVVERSVPYDWADRERHTILADRGNRPVRVEYATRKDGKWKTTGWDARDYDAPIPSGTFAFRVPQGFEAYDIDANRERLAQGAKDGAIQTTGGVAVRLLGAIQERSGRVTAVYTGGTTPLPDAVAYAEREGRRYAGSAIVASPNAPRPLMVRAVARDHFPVRPVAPRERERWDVSGAPYTTLGGVPVRTISFDLPKLNGNPARPLRIVLPVVVEGPSRTVRGRTVIFRGRGLPKGTVTFENVLPIRSNGGEEVTRLSTAIAIGVQIDLARPSAGKVGPEPYNVSKKRR